MIEILVQAVQERTEFKVRCAVALPGHRKIPTLLFAQPVFINAENVLFQFINVTLVPALIGFKTTLGVPAEKVTSNRLETKKTARNATTSVSIVRPQQQIALFAREIDTMPQLVFALRELSKTVSLKTAHTATLGVRRAKQTQ